MGIISKLKSVIGVADGERGQGSDPGTAVTVEREPAAPGERAVKGVDPVPSPEGKDASSDGPVVDDGPSSEDVASGAGGESVDSIKGIGTAYADRLATAGVESVADLAVADAEELAEETGLGTGRIMNWIERARARTS